MQMQICAQVQTDARKLIKNMFDKDAQKSALLANKERRAEGELQCATPYAAWQCAQRFAPDPAAVVEQPRCPPLERRQGPRPQPRRLLGQTTKLRGPLNTPNTLNCQTTKETKITSDQISGLAITRNPTTLRGLLVVVLLAALASCSPRFPRGSPRFPRAANPGTPPAPGD